ncbi:MAG: sugar ABC transporter permease [Treponema sp.]|jgi:ABC-type sugar transport system permease subunit|nr:sugar ABC transporter permease [Treponema sp.]
MKRDNLTLETKSAIAGYLFISPFLIGFLAFMMYPIIESLRMIFSDVRIDTVKQGFSMTFTGLANLNKVFFIDAEFNRMLIEELGRMALIVPAELIFSLFIALILNQEFKARGFVRAVFFLPVILSSGVMVGLETNNTLLNGMAEMIRESNTMKASITSVLEDILVVSEGSGDNAVADFMGYIFAVVNQVYDIAMASGIQIIIFLSALQSISPSVYEAADIEGATKWESFWKVTLPMVSSLILVNVIYSVVDYFIRTDNTVMTKIRTTLMQRLEYGFATAMAWVYFLAVIIILGIVTFVISKKVYYYE